MSPFLPVGSALAVREATGVLLLWESEVCLGTIFLENCLFGMLGLNWSLF